MHTFTPAEMSGSTSDAALLEDSPLDALNYRDRLCLWNTGNIDAPELICQGGCKAVIIQGTFEGVTPKVVYR
jgi:hypothetical protein